MKKLRWAIVGTGKIANRFAAALNNLPEHAELYAAGSRSREKAREFGMQYGIKKAYGDYRELLEDPSVDIVYIATPGSCHYSDTVAALEAGKHVLCEKSFSINAREAAGMAETAGRKGLFLMEAMWTRFFPVHAEIRRLIRGGEIGELCGMTVNFCAAAPGRGTSSRFWNPELGASSLLDLGIYGLSFVSSLMGSPSETASIADIGEEGFDIQHNILLKHDGGKMASINCSQISYDLKNAFVYGTEGRIEIGEPWYKPESMIVHCGGQERKLDFPLGTFNGYEYEIMEVTECIGAGLTESPVMPLSETVAIMRTMDELRKSWGFRFKNE